MTKAPLFLSKTKYLEGLQCPKLLWYRYNRKQDIPPLDRETQEIFEQGRIVGGLARSLFPDGIIVERHKSPILTSNKSQLALKSRKPLFEAGFVYKNSYALPDILVPVENDAWDLIEVKSSTKVKKEHIFDAAFQKYVYEGNGVKIRRIYLMHLNKEYVKQGEIDLNLLFHKEYITDRVDEILPHIEKKINSMLEVIAGSEPEVWVGSQCRGCCLEDHCKGSLPRDHVTILYRGGRVVNDLRAQGIFRLKDIPSDFDLNDKQAVQVRCHNKGETHVDKEGLRDFLDQLKYPLYFLDFETLGLAVPYYDLSRPYEDIPFQFSLHVIEGKGKEPIHYSHLAEGNIDPRPGLLKKLKELLGDAGSIIAFNATYEKKCLKDAVWAYIEYQPWLAAIGPRFVDLYDPFGKFFYYHPDQLGSTSMKRVLPALTGITYDDMEIGDGGMARFEYMRVIFDKKIEPLERQRVFEALKKYCELDTRGMIEILGALEDEIS
jgi:CRISPR/Cas system-associated exonuclease Cas4 (RecB family)